MKIANLFKSKAMSKEQEQREKIATHVLDAIVTVVANQIELSQTLMQMSDVNVMSPDADRNIWDDWTIGYIAGVIDGGMQSYVISESDPLGSFIFQGAFSRLFNNPKINHKLLVDRGIQQLNSQTRAAELGAKDMMRWLKFSFETNGKKISEEAKFINTPNLLQCYLVIDANEAVVTAAKRGFEFR